VRSPGPTHRSIYVRSERSGQQVMESITRFITQKLKLKVNEAKSAVARPQERKFLGFRNAYLPLAEAIGMRILGKYAVWFNEGWFCR